MAEQSSQQQVFVSANNYQSSTGADTASVTQADFPHQEFMFKIVLIGDSGVGKSQLLLRYTKDQFKNKSTSTIGMEFATQSVKVNPRVNVRAQIWDTAGQERYRAITNAYYRQAIGVLLVYDITSKKSFESVDRWLQEVRDHADDKIQISLIGNKKDLEAQRQVSFEEAQKFAEENELYFMESSALTSENVDSAFFRLISRIQEKLESGYFCDRYEQFNYFGNASIRRQSNLMALSAEQQDSAVMMNSASQSGVQFESTNTFGSAANQSQQQFLNGSQKAPLRTANGELPSKRSENAYSSNTGQLKIRDSLNEDAQTQASTMQTCCYGT